MSMRTDTGKFFTPILMHTPNETVMISRLELRHDDPLHSRRIDWAGKDKARDTKPTKLSLIN